jgi:hypothetical protein
MIAFKTSYVPFDLPPLTSSPLTSPWQILPVRPSFANGARPLQEVNRVGIDLAEISRRVIDGVAGSIHIPLPVRFD